MVRAAACLGILALAAALGSLAIVQLVMLPGLEAQHALVDLNLLTRLVQPVHLRAVEITLIASVVLVGVAHPWLRSHLATTLALLAAGGAGLLRLLVLPDAYEAWARVDRVAQAPHDRLVRAQSLIEEAQWLGLATLAMLLLLAVLAGVQWTVPAPSPSRRRHTPTLSDEATTTHDDAVPDAA